MMVRSCRGRPSAVPYVLGEPPSARLGAACPEGPCSFGVCTCPALGPSLRVGCRDMGCVAPRGLHPVRHPHLFPDNQQGAEEEQREELREQQKQLTEVQEALLQEQEAKARVTEENERLRQEVAR